MKTNDMLFAEFFPAVILMIGIPGSGKSTFRKKFFSALPCVSLDELHSRKRENDALDLILSSGRSCVIDNTNVTRAERAKYIGRAHAAGYRVIGCFMQSILRDCLLRNERREKNRRIPRVGVIGRAQKLEIPAYEESFDFLYFVRITADGFEISPWQEEATQ